MLMKTKVCILSILFFCLYACSSPVHKESMLTINMDEEYSDINLDLKDIADIEYIKLANDPGFLVSSRPLVVSKNYILTKGEREGEVLLFNRQGQPVQKFCHYGNGPHDYNYITNLRIDEKRKEIYVHDIFSQKMLVYDLKGDFIRKYSTGDIRFLYNFNEDVFLCYNAETNTLDPELKPYFTLVSKENGTIVKRIDMPKVSGKRHELAVTKNREGGSFTYTAMHLPIIGYKDGYMLNDLSSDTIYKYTFDGTISPFLVRTPSIQELDAPVYLEQGVETGKYIGLVRIGINEKEKQNMFPSQNWVYNKEDSSIHEYKIINEEYPDMNFTLDAHMVNCDIQPGYGVGRLTAGRLVDAYENGKLQGKLKEIAATLNEEDNDVLMVFNFK